MLTRATDISETERPSIYPKDTIPFCGRFLFSLLFRIESSFGIRTQFIWLKNCHIWC